MFPPINNGYQQPQFDPYGQNPPQNNMQNQNFNQFSMNPNEFQPYYLQPYESPINKYAMDLNSYYQNNRDKVFAKFNQKYENPNPPLGAASKLGVPQLPQIRLPVVDWQNFQKDAQNLLSNQNKFMKGLDHKIIILDNLINLNDEWIVEKYYEKKQRFQAASINEKNYKLKKALTDYRKFSSKHYGAFKNPRKNQEQFMRNGSQTSIQQY